MRAVGHALECDKARATAIACRSAASPGEAVSNPKCCPCGVKHSGASVPGRDHGWAKMSRGVEVEYGRVTIVDRYGGAHAQS